MCANSEGSGETARMRRLAWAFAVVYVIVISWAGSFENRDNVVQRTDSQDLPDNTDIMRDITDKMSLINVDEVQHNEK